MVVRGWRSPQKTSLLWRVGVRFEAQPWAWSDTLAAVPVRTDVDGGDDAGRDNKRARVGE